MQIDEDGRLETQEYQLLSALTMWTCVGCGSLGKFRECSGICAYRKLQVIGVEQYADLLERRDAIDEEALTVECLTVWRCASFEQIEAPQPCIGVCTRRTGEYVRAEDYEALRRLSDTARLNQKLAALARQLVRVSPKGGQWERTSQAFRDQAAELLNSAPLPCYAAMTS